MLRLAGSISVVGLLLAALPQVSSAQFPTTDSTNAAATLESLTGQVSVLRDQQAWALNVGSEVKPQQVIVTGPDGYAKFKVSDGSTFEVFPNSRVIFRKNPPTWDDLLEMLLGRVKVHIEKLNGQPNHNRVRTPTAIISVRGTIFDIRIEDEDTTYVGVEEGVVAVEHAIKRGEPRLLYRDDWIRVFKNEPLSQSKIDKGSLLHGALRAVSDAISTAIYRTPGGGGGSVPAGGGTGGGSGGGGLPGDHGGGGNKPPPKSGGGSTTTPGGDAGPGSPPPPASPGQN
jgi:hypothetical protein